MIDVGVTGNSRLYVNEEKIDRFLKMVDNVGSCQAFRTVLKKMINKERKNDSTSIKCRL